MSSNARTANKDPVSAGLFAEGSSQYFPSAWGTVSNSYWDVVQYTPQTVGSWGGHTTWAIPNNVCTYFGKMFLAFRTAAVAGAAGSSYRFDDFLAYAAWRDAHIKYGSQVTDNLEGEFTKVKFYDEQMPLQKRLAIAPYIQGPLPQAARHANLVNGVECLVELPFFFARGYSASLPLVMGSDLHCSVFWRQWSEVIDSDAGEIAAAPAAPLLEDQRLFIQQIYAADNEQAALLSLAQSGIVKLKDSQITTRFINSSPLSGVQTFEIPTPNVNLPTTYQNITLRLQSALNTPHRVRRWEQRGGETDPVVRLGTSAISWNTTSGSIRHPNLPRGLVKPFLSSCFRETPGLSDPIVQMDIAVQPGNASSASGSLNTQFLAGYKVVVPVNIVAGPETLVIDIHHTTKTMVKQQQGNMYPVFQ